MKFEVKLPELGESISEATIGKWLKDSGDLVALDEPLCEIESEKATVELPAEKAGRLKILVEEGKTVAIGDVVAEIDTDAQEDKKENSASGGDAGSSAEKEKQAPAGDASQAAEKKSRPQGESFDVTLPELGESISEATIGKWLKTDGEAVEVDEPLCEIESEKATLELPSEKAGVLKILVEEGQTIKVGETIAHIFPGNGQQAASRPQEKRETAPQSGTPGAEQSAKISPVAANILKEAGIPTDRIKGSGPGGKVTKEDARQAVETAKSQKESEPAPEQKAAKTTETEKKQPLPAPHQTKGTRSERRESMSTLRKTISRRLVASKNETAMLTTFNEVDMSAIMEIRNRYKDTFKEKYDLRLGFMSFFVKAITLALREYPVVNAYVDGDDIVYHDYCDISIAVSTPQGLVVPVIRDAEKLTVAEIEKTVGQLAEKARNKKLSIDEMSGGTFSITNGGVFGSLLSTPIINPPQSAILGMHTIKERPVALDGEIVIRPMMYLSLSYDHRIIDGRESVLFLVRVIQLLEDPARLLLEV